MLEGKSTEVTTRRQAVARRSALTHSIQPQIVL